MTKRAQQSIEEILASIARINGYTAGMDRDSFFENMLVIQGVERNIEIISEATRHLNNEMKAQHSDVPWRSVADIGNVLRHASSSVDVNVLWDIVQRHLPPLKAAVEAMQLSPPVPPTPPG